MNDESTLNFSARSKFVKFPQAERALARLRSTHRDSVRTGLGKGLALLGPSGVGKSTVIKQFASELMAGGKSETGRIIRAVIVQVPAAPTPKSLGSAVLAALGDPLAYVNRHSAEQKQSRAILLLGELKTEFIVFDEAQHLVALRGKGYREITDWLKNFLNGTRSAVVLAGLRNTEELLFANEQLRRRFSATFYYNRFDIDDPDDTRNMGGLLRALQRGLPVASVDLYAPDMLRRFHAASFGLIDYMIKILDRAVGIASLTDNAEISLQILATAFRDEIWSLAPPNRNPFSKQFDNQLLTKAHEPFDGFEVKAAVVGRAANG